ncbi:MAG: hypothetical protein JWO74_3456 [Solirubrobacterales bacterium]|nr:hypothetical protein [Solirubrobacterales bacterium]
MDPSGNRRSKSERPADWQTAGRDAATSLADFRHQIGLTAPYGPAAHKVDPAFSPDPPSRVYAAKLKDERDRRRLELAAESAETLAGTRKRKKGEPPPPNAPPAADPPKRTVDFDPNDLPF